MTADNNQADVTAWFSKCNQPQLPGKKKNSTLTPSLTGESARMSSSSIPASQRSAFSNSVGVKIIVKEGSGGISDRDEMNGEEVEAVHQSPVKKKKTRARSDVNIFVFHCLYR